MDRSCSLCRANEGLDNSCFHRACSLSATTVEGMDLVCLPCRAEKWLLVIVHDLTGQAAFSGHKARRNGHDLLALLCEHEAQKKNSWKAMVLEAALKRVLLALPSTDMALQAGVSAAWHLVKGCAEILFALQDNARDCRSFDSLCSFCDCNCGAQSHLLLSTLREHVLCCHKMPTAVWLTKAATGQQQ